MHHRSFPKYVTDISRTAYEFLDIADSSCDIARRSKLYLGDWDNNNSLDCVEVRGCFDHLHEGHKELLEVAALVTNKRLIVTIIKYPDTSEKSYMAQYQSFDERFDAVTSFLQSTCRRRYLGTKLSIEIMSDKLRMESNDHVKVLMYGSEYYERYSGGKKVIFVHTNNTKHSSDIRKALLEQKWHDMVCQGGCFATCDGKEEAEKFIQRK